MELIIWTELFFIFKFYRWILRCIHFEITHTYTHTHKAQTDWFLSFMQLSNFQNDDCSLFVQHTSISRFWPTIFFLSHPNRAGYYNSCVNTGELFNQIDERQICNLYYAKLHTNTHNSYNLILQKRSITTTIQTKCGPTIEMMTFLKDMWNRWEKAHTHTDTHTYKLADTEIVLAIQRSCCSDRYSSPSSYSSVVNVGVYAFWCLICM